MVSGGWDSQVSSGGLLSSEDEVVLVLADRLVLKSR